MAQEVKVICPYDQGRPLRHIGTTGKSEKCLLSSYFKRNDASSSLLPLWEKVARTQSVPDEGSQHKSSIGTAQFDMDTKSSAS